MKLCAVAAILSLSCFTGANPNPTRAENGHEAWLRYAPLDKATAGNTSICRRYVVGRGDSLVLQSAVQELVRGIQGMLGSTLQPLPGQGGRAIVLSAVKNLHEHPPGPLSEDGFWLKSAKLHGFDCLVVAGEATAGSSTACSRCSARSLAANTSHPSTKSQQPYAPIRWVNQWDNLDGTHRTRLRRPLDFLRRRQSAPRSTRGPRLRSPAGIGGYQRLRHQQRKRQSPCPRRPISCRNSCASPTSSAHGAFASPLPSISAAPDDRRPRHI